MLVDLFDYVLPPELIAQTPTAERDASRLMVLDRKTGRLTHTVFSELTSYLAPGDVLVINDTRVYPARLTGVKKETGGAVEALILKELGGSRCLALVKGRMSPGTRLLFAGGLEAAVVEDLGGGKKVLEFAEGVRLGEALDEVGAMPLPPYIGGKERDAKDDRERYQTVYARSRGAVAAPTAGLHFTERLMARIMEMGVRVAPVTLHVGIGTFMPVRVDEVEHHRMEEEEYYVPEDTAEAVNTAKAEGRRVVAVGTTSARALESATGESGRLAPGRSSTALFIYPGYRFRSVDALVTNFHLPKSTLLMLVCALAGRDATLAAYAEAVRRGYRFYSYGDAMFII